MEPLTASRPQSADDAVVADGAPLSQAQQRAAKLAKIGSLLRKQGEPDAISLMQASLRLDPTQAHVWKALGHALAQDGRAAAARAAFQTAIHLVPPGQDAAARTGLATVLTQLGEPAAAVDELLQIRATGNTAAMAYITEPLERLCRRVMPGPRFAAVQTPHRQYVWKQALLTAFPLARRVLDVSTIPIAAILSCANAAVHRTTVRVETLPMTVIQNMLRANGLGGGARTVQFSDDNAPHASIKLVAASPGGLPTTAIHAAFAEEEGGTRDHDARPSVLLADSDATDLLASPYLATVCAARELLAPNPVILPGAVEIHVALVQSDELAKLNSINQPVGGIDLKALNVLSHRSRVVRLSELKHKLLTQPCVALRLQLDGDQLPAVEGESEVDLVAEAHGTLTAVVVWHAFKIHGSLGLSTEPSTYRRASVEADEDDADSARQVAYYMWAAAPGELTWADADKESAALTASSAAIGAQIAAATGAIGMISTIAKQAANSAALAVDLAVASANRAEAKAEAARARFVAGEDGEVYDEVRIQAADLAQAVAKAAPQEAARARAFADEAILAAGEALHSAADVSKVESQRAEHQTNALASALEVYNWNVTAANTMDASLQAIAIAMQEAVHSAHVTRRGVTDAEAKADSDVREDDDEVIMDDPHEAAQSMMNKREMYAAGLVAARESIKAITDAAASLRSVVKKEASAKAARHAEASAWAAGAATGESPHGMGMLRVSPQQKLKLRMRWRERRCEFQVCSLASDMAARTRTQTAKSRMASLPRGPKVHFVDDAGRYVTATGTTYLAMQKCVLRRGPKMDSDKVGELASLARLHVLQTKTLQLVADDGEGYSLTRAHISREGSIEPLGWISVKSKAGNDMILPVDDPAAVLRLAKGSNEGDSEAGHEEVPSSRAAPRLVVLARSGEDVIRVTEQNFGAASASMPLTGYHFPMLNDSARNEAFASSMVRMIHRVQPSLVLDIGSGTGLLAMLAASRARAPRVLAIEMTPQLASIAQELVDQHDLSESVRVISAHSSQVKLDGAIGAGDPWQARADMLIFEILGTDPLCEGILPALRDARERLLTPSAAIMPCRLEVHVALVQSDELAKLNSINQPVSSVDLRALNALSHRSRAVRLSELKHDLLSKPCVALRLQLDGEQPPAVEGENELEIYARQSGVAVAIVSWFTAYLDDSGRPQSMISTAPGVADPMRGHSWGQCAHFLPSPLKVESNSTFRLRSRWNTSGVSFTLLNATGGSNLKGIGTAEMSSRLQEQLAQIERNVQATAMAPATGKNVSFAAR